MASPTTGRSRLTQLALTPVGLMLIALAVMWAIEIVDTTLLDHRLQRHGIHPRTLGGLEGIAFAPFLHVDYGHVASNSVPLLALGGLVAARGMHDWALTTTAAWIIGGALTWLLAGGTNHIGASGIVFGYFGAILATAVVERRPRALGAAFLTIGFYSSMIVGLVPQSALSWEGHLFGMVGGTVAAVIVAEPRHHRHRGDDPPRHNWELDKPWLGPDNP